MRTFSSPSNNGIVRDILSEFPSFSFALDEYILSLRHAEQVASAWERFFLSDTGQSPPPSVPSYISLGMSPGQFTNASLGNPPNLWLKTTSGTSGKAKAALYSERFYFQQLFVPIRRFFHHAGVNPDELGVILSINNSARSKNCLFKDPLSWFGAIALLNIDERDLVTAELALDIGSALRPIALISKPPLLEMLLDLNWLARLNGVKMIVSSGAELRPELANQLQSELNCPVLDCYALSELPIIGVSCHANCGIHIDATLVDVRIDAKAPQNKGEIIISSSENEAMPLSGYRTQDYAIASEEKCVCGSLSPRLCSLEGKRLPLFRLPKGTFLDPSRFERLMPPALQNHQFEVHQVSATDFLVVIPGDIYTNRSLLEEVKENLQKILSNSCRIEFESGVVFPRIEKYTTYDRIERGVL